MLEEIETDLSVFIFKEEKESFRTMTFTSRWKPIWESGVVGEGVANDSAGSWFNHHSPLGLS